MVLPISKTRFLLLRKTMWRVASVSKPVAATAIMQLVETGAVKLDEPIWTYLPCIRARPPRHHRPPHPHATSGIRHYNYEAGEKESAEYFPTVEAGSHGNGVDREPLQFAPGTAYLYSTYAYLLLAGIVEKASGLSYEAWLAEKIFAPAGMKTACLDRNRELIPHRARFYRKGDSGKEVFNAPYVDSSYKWTAGGIMATVEDLAHYAIALDTGKLLAPRRPRKSSRPSHCPTAPPPAMDWLARRDRQDGRQWVLSQRRLRPAARRLSCAHPPTDSRSFSSAISNARATFEKTFAGYGPRDSAEEVSPPARQLMSQHRLLCYI